MMKWIWRTGLILIAALAVSGGTYYWGINSDQSGSEVWPELREPPAGDRGADGEFGERGDRHEHGGRGGGHHHMEADFSLRSFGRFLPLLLQMAVVIALVIWIPRGFTYLRQRLQN